ncbi:MAG: leucyl/phenylalanyl-tRNA--protein transferase [Deltaproteobacteria bacterium]|nr:leucyl/phenylalanyl-tRNA--protein transferase [Deltaproteobacteria bacterium]
MSIATLGSELNFPHPARAHRSGVLAVGGDLRPDRLLVAYSQGIFPWPAEGYPLLWHCPDPRFVVDPAAVRVNRTLAKALRKRPFTVTLDQEFAGVIAACAEVPRPGQDGTWITPEVVDAYTTLHQMGFAHSVEVWRSAGARQRLVGGLYGVAIGAAFFGESMFSRADNASKVGFVTLCAQLARRGFALVDAQVHTPLLDSLGGRFVERSEFLVAVAAAVQRPLAPGRWTLDPDLAHGWVPDAAA